MSSLEASIERIERELGGTVSLAARDLSTGRRIAYHADRWSKTASVIKLPMLVHIALAVEEGTLDWQTPMPLVESEKTAGSGVLTQLTSGLTLTLRDVCGLMTIVSDNTATNMLIEQFGVAPFNDRMRSLGLTVTTLNRKAYSKDESTELSRLYGLGVTTPEEMMRLLTLLAEGKIGTEATRQTILEILSNQHYRDGIPRLLPETWTYAGKTGAVDLVRNDAGLITTPDGRQIALAIFCQELPFSLWTSDNPGLIAIARLSHLLLRDFTGDALPPHEPPFLNPLRES